MPLPGFIFRVGGTLESPRRQIFYPPPPWNWPPSLLFDQSLSHNWVLFLQWEFQKFYLMFLSILTTVLFSSQRVSHDSVLDVQTKNRHLKHVAPHQKFCEKTLLCMRCVNACWINISLFVLLKFVEAKRYGCCYMVIVSLYAKLTESWDAMVSWMQRKLQQRNFKCNDHYPVNLIYIIPSK